MDTGAITSHGYRKPFFSFSRPAAATRLSKIARQELNAKCTRDAQRQNRRGPERTGQTACKTNEANIGI
jgi:hypothetical protein